MKCQYQNHPARSPSPFQMNSESRDVEMCVDGGGEKNEKKESGKEGVGRGTSCVDEGGKNIQTM